MPYRSLTDVDTAIVNVLVRLNLILESRFPGTGAMSMSSCSGHIGGDESIHPETPYLRIDADASRTSAEQRGEIEDFLRGIFERAASACNSATAVTLTFMMSPEVQTHILNSKPDAGFYIFMIGAEFPTGQTWERLAAFWQAVESQLSAWDRLALITQFQADDFQLPVGTSYRDAIKNTPV